MEDMKNEDFLRVQFSVSDEFGKLIETTDMEEAKKADIYSEKAKYGYSLVMMADTRMVKGFREALLGAKDGEEKTAKIAKADAFGDRREDLVVLVPMKKFQGSGISPQVGMVVDLDGSRGRVQSISSGRVRVDLNHELAGRDVIYKFKIIDRITGPKMKLNALVEEQLNLKNAVTIDGDYGSVNVPQETMNQDDYLQWKYSAIAAAMQYIPELKKIEWKEEFTR
ncbi:MAG: hypothetical protein ABH863_01070 [Candidatus Micrarchaeota archaeon]